jgi:hypothetical protein
MERGVVGPQVNRNKIKINYNSLLLPLFPFSPFLAAKGRGGRPIH